MKSFKHFISGFFVATLLFALTVNVFAATGQKQITASYNDISIYVDGVKIDPKDANGNVTEPFTVDGTTYLPIRPIANALGKDVEWDQSTKSVYIGTPGTPGTTPSKNNSSDNRTEKKIVTLSSGNYTVGVDIDPGTYNLVAISGGGNAIGKTAEGRLILNEIMGNETNQLGNFYSKTYNNLKLSDGDTISISSTLKLQFIQQ